ncbi:MAG: hypothetical protein ACTSV1_06665, partial [Alphaproteobacteria bacterium]
MMARVDKTHSTCTTPMTLSLTGLACALLLGVPGDSQAAQLDCDVMAARLNPGDRYEFTIELQSKTMRLEKGADFCTESSDDWFARQLILPRPARDERLRKAADPEQKAIDKARRDIDGTTPLPGQIMRQGQLPDMGLDSDSGGVARLKSARSPEGWQNTDQAIPGVGGEPGTPLFDGAPGTEQSPAGTSPYLPGEGSARPPGIGVAAPPSSEVDPDNAKICEVSVTDLWAPGEYDIDGKTFWLAGVFTIDYDGDGRVDDVGFKINAEGKIGNVLNYFPATENRLSGKTVASLRLDDERDIGRLCADNVTFDRPDPVEDMARPEQELKQESAPEV